MITGWKPAYLHLYFQGVRMINNLMKNEKGLTLTKFVDLGVATEIVI